MGRKGGFWAELRSEILDIVPHWHRSIVAALRILSTKEGLAATVVIFVVVAAGVLWFVVGTRYELCCVSGLRLFGQYWIPCRPMALENKHYLALILSTFVAGVSALFLICEVVQIYHYYCQKIKISWHLLIPLFIGTAAITVSGLLFMFNAC